MRKKILILYLLTATFLPSYANTPLTDTIQRATVVYAIKGTDTLKLDKYNVEDGKTGKPCLLFVFGGGFLMGARDYKDYNSYFNEWAQKGYVVLSIDYRLGLKKAFEARRIVEKEAKEKGEDPPKIKPVQFLSTFDGAISMAVEDLFDATSYIVEHAVEWNINKDLIIASGSSAGAVTVLHGEYNICNHTELAQRLPPGFNYAGIISFAGAIFSMKGDIKWASNPAPILLFHGDADRNVPYDNVRVKVLFIPLKYGFFGSKHIDEQLDKMKVPHYFYSIENAAHEIAVLPMLHNQNEMQTFLDKIVLNKEMLMMHTGVQQPGKPDMKKKFKMQDYFKSNGF